MTKHERLKEISDLIGYEIGFLIINGFFTGYQITGVNETTDVIVNEKEIIFDPEFIKLFIEYYRFTFTKCSESKQKIKQFKIDLLDNLEDPVDYLYKLLKLG